MDELHFRVVKSPDAQLVAMQLRETDILTDLTRQKDIEKLSDEGFTITSAPGFHIEHIGFNIRPTEIVQAGSRAPEAIHPVTYWPLADVNFRHALVHAYDQEGIIYSLYGYIVVPVRSLVPPAQEDWFNPNIPEHPFNLGDPFTSPAGEHSTVGILKAAGYTFVDADEDGLVSPADYWLMPNGDKIPDIHVYTPTYEVAPTSAEHGARWIEDLAKIGLQGTTDNGFHGFIHEPQEFWPYITKVFQDATFDAYMVFWGLGRFPDHLYDMLHSSQISGPPPFGTAPWRYNAPGVNSTQIDELVEIIKTSLDHSAKLEATFKVQELMYNVTAEEDALAYMILYSRIHFNAYNPDLRGIVNSPGYGSDNKWTSLSLRWEPGSPDERIDPDGNSYVIYTLAEEPERLNPAYAGTAYAWTIIDGVMDELLAVDPYAHRDLPWIATSWEMVADPDGVPGAMNVTFYLATNVTWQDGYPYTAWDAMFSLLFTKEWEIPRYTSIWKYIVDVVVIDDYTFTVISNATSQFLLYDFASLAAMFPPQVWDRDWTDLDEILSYNPADEGVGYDPAPGYDPGPTPPPTNLFGTGPWIFQYYDEIGFYGEVWQNPNYFRTTESIQNQLTELFHEIGDVNRDGVIDLMDYFMVSKSYNSTINEPEYNPDADLNEDGIIDIFDILVNGGGVVAHWGWQRTYPDGGSGGTETSSSLSTEGGGDTSQLTLTAEGGAQQSSAPVIYINPPQILNYSLKANDTFSVDINIANVTDLMGYDFRLKFNSNILNATSVVAGDFFGENITIWHETINNDAGIVHFAVTPDFGTTEGTSGSGRLATITFSVKAYGNSSLKLKGFTKLSDSDGIRIYHVALDGYFDNTHPADINKDGTVDIKDLSIISKSYGYMEGEPEYNPDADLNDDGIIDLMDLVIAAFDFGWTWETDP
jgi:ABC-type transport system substrate-binding protein